MCNHSYTQDHFKNRSIGKRCHYPQFYERARSTAPSGPERSALALPMDDSGSCLFHSQQIAWKRQQDFRRKFLELVQLLEAEADGRDFDFAEFVFVGSDLGKKTEVPNNMSYTSRILSSANKRTSREHPFSIQSRSRVSLSRAAPTSDTRFSLTT